MGSLEKYIQFSSKIADNFGIRDSAQTENTAETEFDKNFFHNYLLINGRTDYGTLRGFCPINDMFGKVGFVRVAPRFRGTSIMAQKITDGKVITTSITDRPAIILREILPLNKNSKYFFTVNGFAGERLIDGSKPLVQLKVYNADSKTVVSGVETGYEVVASSTYMNAKPVTFTKLGSYYNSNVKYSQNLNNNADIGYIDNFDTDYNYALDDLQVEVTTSSLQLNVILSLEFRDADVNDAFYLRSFEINENFGGDGFITKSDGPYSIRVGSTLELTPTPSGNDLNIASNLYLDRLTITNRLDVTGEIYLNGLPLGGGGGGSGTVIDFTNLSVGNIFSSGVGIFKNDVNVSGVLTTSALNINDSLTVTGILYSRGGFEVDNMNLSNDLTVSGVTTLFDILKVYGPVGLNSTLYVTGGGTFNTSLVVYGDIFNSGSIITRSLTVFDNVNIASLLSVERLYVSGTATINSGLFVTGNTTLNGNLLISGSTTTINLNARNLTVSELTVNSLTFNQPISISGTVIDRNLLIAGNATFSNNIRVLNSETIHSNLLVTGAVTVHNGMNVSGAAVFNNTFRTVGNATFNQYLFVNGVATFNDVLHVDGAATFSSAVYMNDGGSFANMTGVSLNIRSTTTTQNLVINNVTTANNLMRLRKSLIVEENITTGDINLNGDFYVNGVKIDWSNFSGPSGTMILSTLQFLTVLGDTTINSSLLVRGNAEIQGNMTLGNINLVDATVYSNLDIQGRGTIGGGLTVTGNSNIQGNLVVTGDMSVMGTFYTMNSENIYMKDNIIEIGFGNTTDAVDQGIAMRYNNTYSAGIIRKGSDRFYLYRDIQGAVTNNISITPDKFADLTIANLSANHVQINGNVTLTSNLSVTGQATIQRQLAVNNSLLVLGSIFGSTLTITGSLASQSVSGITVTASGGATASTLRVTGLAIVSSLAAQSVSGITVTASGGATVSSLIVTGQATVSSLSAQSVSGITVTASGGATVSSLIVTGQATVSSLVAQTVSGITVTAAGGLTASSLLISGNAVVSSLTVSGDASLNTLNITGIISSSLAAQTLSGITITAGGQAVVSSLVVTGAAIVQSLSGITVTASGGATVSTLRVTGLATVSSLAAQIVSAITITGAGLATVSSLLVTGGATLSSLIITGDGIASNLSAQTLSGITVTAAGGLTASSLVITGSGIATALSAPTLSGITVTAAGRITASNLFVTGATTLASTLITFGIGTFNSSLNVRRDLIVTGATTLLSSLYVTGLIDGGNGLNINGATTLNGDTTFRNLVNINSNVAITGNLVLTGNQTITNTLTIGSQLNVANLSSTSLQIGGEITMNSSATIRRNLVVSGLVTLASSLTISRDLQVSGTGTISNGLIASTLIISGQSTFNGRVNVINSANEFMSIQGTVGVNVFNESTMSGTFVIDKYLLVKLSGDNTDYYLPLLKNI